MLELFDFTAVRTLAPTLMGLIAASIVVVLLASYSSLFGNAIRKTRPIRAREVRNQQESAGTPQTGRRLY